MIKTIEWTEEGVRMIDQRVLPNEETYVTLQSCEAVADAIRTMVVRGAPAIGVSAAMGLALGAKQSKAASISELEQEFDRLCEMMSETRPTAVNLFWAIEKMRQELARLKTQTSELDAIKGGLEAKALQIFQEDIDANRGLGRFG